MLAVINDWPAMCWLTMLRMRVIAVQAVFSCWNVVLQWVAGFSGMGWRARQCVINQSCLLLCRVESIMSGVCLRPSSHKVIYVAIEV